jgi:phenylacetate-coenzyme A ligase PaaK-like adenylate-forming protein
MTTSGSSGRKGLFVYDAQGWRAIAAMFFRQSAWMGSGRGCRDASGWP